MKKANPIASIILPVHNAGPYITESLESLVSQTLQDIEVIAVLACALRTRTTESYIKD